MSKQLLSKSEYVKFDPLNNQIAHINFPSSFLQINVPLENRNDEQALELLNLQVSKVKRMNATFNNWIVIVEDAEEIKRLVSANITGVDLIDIKQIHKVISLKTS